MQAALGLAPALQNNHHAPRACPSAKRVSGKPAQVPREEISFTRNLRLAAETKRLHNYTCEVYSFKFRQHYGALRESFVECHRKNPLAERPEELWSQALTASLDEAAMVYANCHRMLHRQRIALSVETLRTH
jgi:predicted HNH restriction endonuclease